MSAMQDETYNGWTNRETWAVALHINNDQGWQESVHEALTTARDEYEPSDELDHFNSIHAGDVIKDNVEQWVEYMAERDTPEAAGDLWGILSDIGSLWRVNWRELGASFLEDIED